MLRSLGDGGNPYEALGIRVPASRPVDHRIDQEAYEVEVMRLPKERGGEGMTSTEAIAKVAELYKKRFETIEHNYRSARGNKVREEVKKQADLAAEHGFAQRWPGPERGK